MGTRTNIVIKDSFIGATFYIYRHWDGYPAYPGEDVLKIAKMNSATEAIKHLLNSDSQEYELTNCIHSDIEHLYVVELPTGKIEYGKGLGVGQTESKTREQFAEIVNTDRKHINEYIKANYPEDEWDLFEMVEV